MRLGLRSIPFALVLLSVAVFAAASARPAKRTAPVASASAMVSPGVPTAPAGAANNAPVEPTAAASVTGTTTAIASAAPVLAAGVAPAAATEYGADPTPSAALDSAKQGVGKLADGWSSFGDTWLLLDMFIVLVLALALGATIAYHPSIRRRHSTLEQFEQPKTLLMYAVVAAVVALIVQVQPAMAFVIFGIGGLLRFRTEVGEAKDTGRVILVTVVGLCCGLKIFIVALPATLIGWLLIWALERQLVGIIRVSGVPEASMHEAPRAYRDVIKTSGCTVIAEQTKFMKRQFEFVVKAPANLDRAAVQNEFEHLSATVQGVVVWEGL